MTTGNTLEVMKFKDQTGYDVTKFYRFIWEYFAAASIASYHWFVIQNGMLLQRKLPFTKH